MGFWSKLGSGFRKLGSLIKEGLGSAVVRGLTDDIVKTALVWVRVAATKFTDNAERRNFVIQILVSKGIPESIARIAVELAVQIAKKRL